MPMRTYCVVDMAGGLEKTGPAPRRPVREPVKSLSYSDPTHRHECFLPGGPIMRETWTFHTAAQLLFGRNAVRQLGDVAGQHGFKRALLVTDTILVRAGLAERVHAALSEGGVAVEVFRGGEPEPSLQAAEACIAAARRWRPDVLVGLGGGSNMDLAKVTATALAHGGGPLDHVGDGKIPGPVHPLICVPTTAGTGSEVSAAAVLTDTANHIKVGMLSNFLRP